VSGALYDAAGNQSGKPLLVLCWLLRRRAKSAVGAPQDDGRHLDLRASRKLALNFEKPLFARRVPVPVAVGMQGDFHEVWVVERRSRPPKGFIGVGPFGRPGLPEMPDDSSSVLFQADPPLIGIEVPLIPAVGLIQSRGGFFSVQPGD